MFRFQDPQYFWLMIIPALLTILFILSLYSRKRKLKKLGDLKIINSLMPYFSLFRRLVKFILIVLALVFMITALARPQIFSESKEIKKSGIEIVIALDVSRSMLAQDVSPNRLQSAKFFIERIINRLDNNKLGLVVFSYDAFVQMPLTTDVRSAKMYLSSINTEMLPTQGTDIANALETSSKLFSNDQKSSKLIILISDGENHEVDAIEFSKSLKDKNIKTFCIGIGTTKGVPIPLKNGGLFKDKNGNVVITTLNESTLKGIAENTNGIYVRASNSTNAYDKILSEIDVLEKGEFTKQQDFEYKEIYKPFMILAFICLALGIFISDRKYGILKKLNLFKEN